MLTAKLDLIGEKVFATFWNICDSKLRRGSGFCGGPQRMKALMAEHK